ncbi:MAG: UDP-N-acetylglucosamine 2-epimerase, partial [Bacteroidota bacterium]
HLAKEGVSDEKIFFVGNVMIDSLVHFRAKAAESKILEEINVASKEYTLMTMHRPHNVDHEKGLKNIIQIIRDATRHKKVVFAIHPRTANNMKKFGLYEELEAIEELILLGPQGYLEFLKLMDNAALIITDSGGIQEETTYLQVPCMTFRDTTERPVTVDIGTNFLMKDLNPVTVRLQMEDILSGKAKQGIIPPLWDGKTAERITAILWQSFSQRN